MKPVRKQITFQRLLQHWSTSIVLEQDNLTLFLRLLKHFRPRIDYDSLPSTAKTLLKIDKKKMPTTQQLKGGKYIHFGLEKGLAGESPGLVFENADVMQYVSLFKETPEIVPEAI